MRWETTEQSSSARVTRFTLVDLVIVIAVVFAISSGYRRGFWLSLAQYAGLVLGVVIGAALAPVLMDAINVTGASIRSLGAVLILIVLGAIGSSVGYWVGEPIRLRLLAHPQSGRIDSVAGAIFSALAVLSVSWFLGLSLARLPSPQLSSAIQRSAVLRALDSVAPRPPGFLARVEAIIAGVNFAPVFSGLEPLSPSPQALPTSVDTPGVRTAQSETLKIQGYGCGGIVFGSGFPVGPGLVLTNAHVVAGTQGTTVRNSVGRSLSARVVLFDSQRDVAILYVPQLALPPLPEASAGRGTEGAAIGYPGGGGEQVSPAVVNGEVKAEGRDIYGQRLVVRSIWIIQAKVEPGNSGGPLVDLNGSVIGVIFAASTSSPGQAYALTDAEVQPDIDQAEGRTASVPVGACAM
ncbi:MAG: MarP family serine protease [Chloroflexota bacterium]|nr:MAG: MarP family serine protease [Chloroflexota bacterium]TMD86835.1 MAG: MarP family serine protease [Chloroflexota bacterium]